MQWWKKLAALPFIGFIRIYQVVVSPWIGSNCRYHPSCSQYSIEAFKKYGAVKGIVLTLKRLSRCHPWGGSGHDPVP